MRVMIRIVVVCTLVGGSLAVLAAGPSWALDEPLALYENWRGADHIRADRWNGFTDTMQEFRTVVQGHGLSMHMRKEGATTTDTGAPTSFHRLFFAVPALVTQIDADVKVTGAEATGCATNPTASSIRPVALTLIKFGDGFQPPPGDLTGDYLARVLVFRSSDSADAPGLLRGQLRLSHCLDPVCANATLLTLLDFPNVVEMHRAVHLNLSWDDAGSRFVADVDGTILSLFYPPELNARPSSNPLADIRQIGIAASCTSGATVVDGTVEVGEVRTNASAVVP